MNLIWIINFPVIVIIRFICFFFQRYLQNLTSYEKISWSTPGSFHGFPLLPIHPTQCQLGQLTMQGVLQHLTLGSMLREIYLEVWPKLKNLSHHDVVAYSTRYRRTFQSALAFLRNFLPNETLTKIQISESQSMNFCFKDCGCPATEKLSKWVLRLPLILVAFSISRPNTKFYRYPQK